jgi:hypothetical protein
LTIDLATNSEYIIEVQGVFVDGGLKFISFKTWSAAL